MRRALISCVVVLVALLAQLTFVNRLALPGGAGPDLVLLAVVALSLTGGPLPGLATGFLAGLALDVAPPASHTIGEYALVFCLVGYGCGRLAELGDASPGLYVAISAAAAAVGAGLHAVLGIMLSDPQVTWAAVRHVLPPTLIYDVILSPFVLYAVVRLTGWADRSAAEESAAAAATSAARPGSVAAAAGFTAGAVRQATSAPKLNFGDRRGGGSTVRPRPAGRPGAGPEPKLHFRGAHDAGSAAIRGAARSVRPKAPKMRFGTAGRRDGLASPSARPKTPKVRFGAGGRRDSLGGRGAGAPVRAAAPRFRRSSTGTVGTGGALSRATPRRGTFAHRKTFAGSGQFGGSRQFPRRGQFTQRSVPRLRMRRGTLRASLRRLLPRRLRGSKYSGKYGGKYSGMGGYR